MWGDRYDQYDFLKGVTTYPVDCDDLNSFEISELIEKGLLFAPDVDGPQGKLEEQLLTSLSHRVTETDLVDTHVESEPPPEYIYPNPSQVPDISSSNPKPEQTEDTLASDSARRDGLLSDGGDAGGSLEAVETLI